MTAPIWLNLALIAFTAAAFGAGPALARPTLPFGVRIPARRIGDPAVARTRRRYNRGIVTTAVIAGLAVVLSPAVLDWTPRIEVVLTTLIAVCALLGSLAHHSVVTAKRDGDWYAGTKQAVAADTSLRTDPVRPQWILVAPAAALAVITTVVGMLAGAEAYATVFAQFLIVALVALLALAIPRARPEIDAGQPAGSATRYRDYLHGVLSLLLVSAGCANATLLVVSLQVWTLVETTVPITVVGYSPLVVAFAAWTVFSFRAGDAGHRLAPSSDVAETRYEQRDDDRHWRVAGMVYLNRNDPALLVHRRVGTYWTLNLGHPVSWVILIAVAVAGVLAGFGVVTLPSKGA